jgi:hypothetical protein
MLRKALRFVAVGLVALVYLIAVAWAAGALYFDLPAAASLRSAAAILWAVAALALPIFLRPRWRSLAIGVAGFAVILGWWFTLKPSNDRPWQPDVAQTAWAEINGDTITFHNVRNCEYRTETDYTPRWETRTVHVSKLTGLDIALCYWGSPLMAHPIASFQFADSLPVCFSIETRKEVGESYSAIGGFYRQYELIYLVADERDVIRLRTNFRYREDAYLYHLKIPPERVRERFMDYVTALNELHRQPRWYNAVTANCTTSIRTQHDASERTPWDWRMLANGYSDEMLYERGGLDTSVPFAELKQRVHINERARAANDAPDFSARIRAVGEKVSSKQ